ncbi:MAG: DUF6776 family protein [Propionivibrio sp.]
MAIRAQVAWYWKVLVALVVLVALSALSAWVFEAGKSVAVVPLEDPTAAVAPISDVLSLNHRVLELDEELSRLRKQVSSSESSLQIERTTLKQLSRQVKVLELENAALKEDLALFEGLMPAATDADDGVRIEHFRVEPDISAGQYHYRMLVINSGSGQRKEFKGKLQFLVKVKRQGKDVMITIPSGSESSAQQQQYRFETKYFRRLEGIFAISPDSVVIGVEARLLQDGEVRAKQALIL